MEILGYLEKVFYDGKFYGDIHHWRDVIAWMPLPKPYESEEHT